MYQITEYSKKKARELGVLINPSKRKHKKIDVYDSKGKYITSIGDSRYSDYHERNKNDDGDAGYYAKELLW